MSVFRNFNEGGDAMMRRLDVTRANLALARDSARCSTVNIGIVFGSGGEGSIERSDDETRGAGKSDEETMDPSSLQATPRQRRSLALSFERRQDLGKRIDLRLLDLLLRQRLNGGTRTIRLATLSSRRSRSSGALWTLIDRVQSRGLGSRGTIALASTWGTTVDITHWHLAIDSGMHLSGQLAELPWNTRHNLDVDRMRPRRGG